MIRDRLQMLLPTRFRKKPEEASHGLTHRAVGAAFTLGSTAINLGHRVAGMGKAAGGEWLGEMAAQRLHIKPEAGRTFGRVLTGTTIVCATAAGVAGMLGFGPGVAAHMVLPTLVATWAGDLKSCK